MSSDYTEEETNYKIASIADIDAAVDDIVKRGRFKELAQWDLTPFEEPLLARSPALQRFLALRHLHRQSAEVAQEYRMHDERNRAAFRADACSRRHLEGFKFTFGEVARPFSVSSVRRFLDLGCAPGGFAAYVLEENVDAEGVGLTLSPAAGGLRMQLDSTLCERFDVQFADVRDVAMGRSELENVPAGGFELVTAHAAIMLAEDVIRWTDSIGLIYAQLVLAFAHLAPGAALVTSVRARPLAWVVDVISFLLGAFDDVRAVNPTFQARRPFAYVVCTGFRCAVDDREYEARLDRLRACVAYLENATGPVNDPEHGAANIPRLCGEPGEAVPEDAGARFLDLFDGVWTSKYTAIRANFEKLLHAGASMQGDGMSAGNESLDASSAPAERKYRPPGARGRGGRWPTPTPAMSPEGRFKSKGWGPRAEMTVEPDEYEARRARKNAGLDALFGGTASTGTRADRAESWRRG